MSRSTSSSRWLNGSIRGCEEEAAGREDLLHNPPLSWANRDPARRARRIPGPLPQVAVGWHEDAGVVGAGQQAVEVRHGLHQLHVIGLVGQTVQLAGQLML